MMTLIFFAGVGVGTFVSGACFFAILGWACRGVKQQAKQHQEVTEKLMRDRNETDSKIEQHLAVIADRAKQP